MYKEALNNIEVVVLGEEELTTTRFINIVENMN